MITVDVYYTLSNDAIASLPISATAGTYTGLVTYRGRDYVYEAIAGAASVDIQNVFQSGSLHQLKMYDGAGALVDDTVYNITTNYASNTSVSGVQTIEFDSVGGETYLEDNRFKGASNIQLFIEQSFIYGWIKTADNRIDYPFPLGAGQHVTIKVLK